jgi:CBS domain containing-hemolysin-like protein
MIRALPDVAADLPLVAAIDIMQTSNAHMARVYSADRGEDSGHVLGVITLDDILASLVRADPTS